jgi:hypothetical protein
MEAVWVFNGVKSTFPAGVFSTLAQAEAWIAGHKLSGTLTKYPVDIGVYEWARAQGFFEPKRPDHSSPGFIQTFSSASQEHYHYEAGRCCDDP